ncbi:MAG: hypothetical protein K8F91_20460, partial [Candidatus Obscuribacterales bacterium]|nr:hypothetical protein [Candidatus Obscuribacterales bacterium]
MTLVLASQIFLSPVFAYDNQWRDLTDAASDAMKLGKTKLAKEKYEAAITEAEEVKAEDDLLA